MIFIGNRLIFESSSESGRPGPGAAAAAVPLI